MSGVFSRRAANGVDHLSECFALCESIVQRYSRAGRMMSIGERLAMESMLRVLPLPSLLEKRSVENDLASATFDIEAALKESTSSSVADNGVSRVLRFIEEYDDSKRKTEDILSGVISELKKVLNTSNVRLYRVLSNDVLLLDSVSGVACSIDDSSAVGKCASEEGIFSIGSTLYIPLRVKEDFVGCIEAFGAASAPTNNADFLMFVRAVSLVIRNLVRAEALQNEKERADAMVSMATRLSRDTLDESVLVDSIMNTAKALTESDRCSLFIINDDKTLSAHFEGGHKVHLPRGTGIAGHVAETGDVVNIRNAYEDPRFTSMVDKLTGYHTRTILCLPVMAEGSIVAVAQLLNKTDLVTDSGLQLPRVFGPQDEELFSVFSAFAGAALRNCRINDDLVREVAKSEAIREVVTLLCATDIRDTNSIVQRILAGAKRLINAERSVLFLVDKEKNELYCPVGDSNGNEIRFPVGDSIAGTVASTGKGECIEDAYSDSRFLTIFDKQVGGRTQSLLAEPITLNGEVLAVLELVNKMNHQNDCVPFSSADRETFKVFSLFAGISINNSNLLAFAVKAGQEAIELNDSSLMLTNCPRSPNFRQQRSVDEVTVDLDGIRSLSVPENIGSRSFDLPLLRETSKSPLDSATAVVYQLIVRTGLCTKLNCQDSTLLNFIFHCRALYRRIPYHNFFHAVDVCQTIYTYLYEDGAQERFTDMECFVLLISSLVLNLDHMGVNNSFHIRADSPLGVISSATGNPSVLEVHHCSLALTILADGKSDVFEGVSEAARQDCLRLMVSCVLATDMARHEEVLEKFLTVTESGYDKSQQEHRLCALEMLIKAADLSNACRPFDQSRKWAMAVTEEFYRQGNLDNERGLDVIPVFDRAKNLELARGQLTHITKIVLKFFTDIVDRVFHGMQWCIESILANQTAWEDVLA